MMARRMPRFLRNINASATPRGQPSIIVGSIRASSPLMPDQSVSSRSMTTSLTMPACLSVLTVAITSAQIAATKFAGHVMS